MSDEFTEVTHESWFSRIGSAFKGVLIGFVLFVISFPLLFWNEGRAVQTARSLTEGRGAVVSVASDSVDAANEGALVHLSGEATTEDVLEDPEFGVSVNAIRLDRDVEMFQWVQHEKSESRKKLGGGRETVTTYSYEREWTGSHVDSSRFKKPEGHVNPSSMPFASRSSQAKDVTLGAFDLPEELVSRIDGSRAVTVEPAKLPEDLRGRLAVRDGGYYMPANVPTNPGPADDSDDGFADGLIDEPPSAATEPAVPGSPEIGDVRIHFTATDPTEVSVIAQQTGSTLAPYQSEAGDALFMLADGTQSADAMFESAAAANRSLTWILRAAGTICMFAGLWMMLGPLSVLADVVPILGNIVGFGTGLIAGLVAICLSLTTIGIAWIFYRPMIGIPLVVVGIGIAVRTFTRIKQPDPAKFGDAWESRD